MIPRSLFHLSLMLFALMSTVADAKAPLSYPTQDDWLAHTQVIGEYWLQPDAYGTPPGRFPTFRCDNGRLPSPEELCQELVDVGAKDKLGRRYTRMQSRQIYTYLALFHMTGEPAAFTMASAGIQELLKMRRPQGGFALYVNANGQASDEPVSAQDAAYALLGLAMYDYLTRDPAVHQILLREIDALFTRYYDPEVKALSWWPRTTSLERNPRRELVAQLDQLTAYLNLVSTVSTSQENIQLNRYRQWVVQALLDQYVDLDQCRVFGALHHKYFMLPDHGHNDFGHAVKTWWNLILNRDLLTQTHQQQVQSCLGHTLNQATRELPVAELLSYLPDTKRDKWVDAGTLTTWKGYHYENYVNSWQWAELDQGLIIAKLVGEGPLQASLPSNTWQFLDAWVDTVHGGVGLNPHTNKQFDWLNGYHHTEHALFGLLATQTIYAQPVTLYFAFPSEQPSAFFPYLLGGQVVNITPLTLPNRCGSKVVFNRLHVTKESVHD